MIKNRGIALTEIVVGLVAAFIIGIIIYNIFHKYDLDSKKGYSTKFLEDNASLALSQITTDILNSMAYAVGCSKNGLIKPKYGGYSSPDEMTIIVGRPFSWETVLLDMQDTYSPLSIKQGHSFRIDQKLVVCDDTNLNWITVGQIATDPNKKLSMIFPKHETDREVISKNYLAGTVIGSFEEVKYHIEKSKDGIPSLIRSIERSDKKTIIAPYIENIRFEYLVGESTVPIPEPLDNKAITGVKVTIYARSENNDANNLVDINPFSGIKDGYLRIKLSADIPFRTLDIKILDGISFRILPDPKSSNDFPLIMKEGNL